MPKGINSFLPFDEDESAHYLADHWPNGKLFGKKHYSNSVIYKFMKSIGTWIQVFSGDLYTFIVNRDIDQSSEYLENWEASVKIPSDIPRRDTLEGRQEAVKCLISKIPVYNINTGVEDIKTTFEEYVRCLTGIEIQINTSRVEDGGSEFPLIFPVGFGIGAPLGNFLFTIGVPVEGSIPANNLFAIAFPFQFFEPTIPDATKELLDLILDRVIPSFCRWEYSAIIAE